MGEMGQRAAGYLMPDAPERRAEYLDAKTLADSGAPSRVFLMAAMLIDDENAQQLAQAFPGLFAETMRRRWDSTDGTLLGDDQDQEPAPPKLDALGS